jgi:dGTPase
VSFEETVEMMAAILQTQFDRQKLDRLHSLNGKLGVLRAMAINKLLDECTTAFLDFETSILDGKFDQALTDNIPSHKALKTISEISIKKIYRAKQVVEIEAAGHEVLPGLLHEFIEAGIHYMKGGQSRKYANLALMLPEEILFNCKQSKGDAYLILRELIDFVSGLTDRHALSLFRKIKGVSC